MNFTKILESFEELIYEIFVWILLLPKTLTKVIVNPKWMVDYMNQQLTGDDDLKKKFNNYLSPILFWLLLVGLTTVFYFNQYVKTINFSTAYLNQFVFSNDAERIATTKKFFDIQSWLDIMNILFVSFYLVLILSFSVVIQLLEKTEISRTAIRKNIYIQFYCFAPLQFMNNLNGLYQLTNFNITELFHQLMTGQSTHHNTNPDILLGTLVLISFVWFIIAEAIVIAEIFKKNWIHSLSVIVLSFLTSIVILFILILIASPFTGDMTTSIKDHFK